MVCFLLCAGVDSLLSLPYTTIMSTRFIFLKKYGIGVGLALLFLLIGGNMFFAKVREVTFRASLPLQSLLWKSGASVAQFSEGILYPSALSKEAQYLRDEQSLLISELLSLQDIKREYELLLQSIGNGLPEDFRLQRVDMIGIVPGGDMILIGQGREEGVHAGMSVITSGRVFVGVVKEAFPHASTILLPSHKDFAYDTRIAEKNVMGVVQGAGQGRASMEFLPPDALIETGDIIVTNRIGSVLPPNLFIGVVRETQQVDVESFQRAHIDLTFSPRSLELLFLVVE